MLDAALAHAVARGEQFLADLFRLLAQPSVSSENTGVAECAALVQEYMAAAGLEHVQAIASPGHPFLYGDWLHAPGAPTVLFYGHYDVQPARPDEWESPPFTPTVRNGRIYARGVGDNKGQFFAHLCAIASYLHTAGRLPVNVKFLLEGEEENGSPHVDAMVTAHRELLRADLAYTSDGAMHESGRPTLIGGVRGILYVDLAARGARQDYHSGNKGNLVPNPAWRLAELLATMRDGATGRVLIEGFYDDVRPATPPEREVLRAIPYNEHALAAEHGLPDLGGADGETVFHRLMFEPTLNICGFHSGVDGPGMKTTIPCTARLKMDMRLVADQDPDRIWEAVRRHVERVAPDVEIRRVASMRPSRTPVDLPVVQIIVGALRAATGEEPVILPSLGGSLPDYVFTGILGIPSVIVPYGNFDQANHGPNENMRMELFHRGIRCTIYSLAALGG